MNAIYATIKERLEKLDPRTPLMEQAARPEKSHGCLLATIAPAPAGATITGFEYALEQLVDEFDPTVAPCADLDAAQEAYEAVTDVLLALVAGYDQTCADCYTDTAHYVTVGWALEHWKNIIENAEWYWEMPSRADPFEPA